MFQKSETEKVLSCHNPYKQKVCKKSFQISVYLQKKTLYVSKMEIYLRDMV